MTAENSMEPLQEADPEIAAVLEGELGRQRDALEMIASENFVPKAVLQAQGSVLTNKYAEGYPGRRYYGGCEWVDVAEHLAVVDQDGVDPAIAGSLQALETAQAGQADRLQRRVGEPRVADLLHQLLEGHAHPAEHRLEEVRLVLEVPVDGASRHARVTGDLLQGGAGHALLEEHLLGGVEQGLACRGGFGLGLSRHGGGLQQAMMAPFYSIARPFTFVSIWLMRPGKPARQPPAVRV